MVSSRPRSASGSPTRDTSPRRRPRAPVQHFGTMADLPHKLGLGFVWMFPRILGAIFFVAFFIFQDVPFMLPHAHLYRRSLGANYTDDGLVKVNINNLNLTSSEETSILKGKIYPASWWVGQELSFYCHVERDGLVTSSDLRTYLKIGGMGLYDGSPVTAYVPRDGIKFEVTVSDVRTQSMAGDDLILVLKYHRGSNMNVDTAMDLQRSVGSKESGGRLAPKGKVVVSSSLFLLNQVCLVFFAIIGALFGPMVTEESTIILPDVKLRFRRLFYWPSIVTCLPLAIGWSIAAYVGYLAAYAVDPTFYSVMIGLRYVFTAILSVLILDSRYTKMQWGILLFLCAVAISFDQQRQKEKNTGEIWACALVVVQILLNVVCNVASVVIFRGQVKAGMSTTGRRGSGVVDPLTDRLTVLENVAHVTMGSLLFVVPIVVASSYMADDGLATYGLFGGPHFGWDWRAVAHVMLNSVHIIIGAGVAKFRGAVTRHIFGGGGAAFSYFARTQLGWDLLTAAKACHVVAIAIGVVCYQLVPPHPHMDKVQTHLDKVAKLHELKTKKDE